MKTIRLFTLAAMVLLAAMPLMAVNAIMYTATYDKSPQLGTDTLGGVTYSTVAYEGLYNGGDPGMPSLPVDYIKFSVPYNAVNFTVSTLLRNTFIYNVPHLLYPCQEPVPTDGSEPQGITLPDSAAYFSNTTFPSQQAWVVDEGFLAGENHIVTVAVMPISYYHGSGSNAYNRVKVSETVRLTLRYELNDSTAPAPLIRQDSVLRQEGYELTQSLVANPGNVVANAPVMMTMDSTLVFNPLSGGDGLNGGDQTIGPGIGPGENTGYGGQLQEAEHNVPYLIVTTNELYHSMRRLAALKRQKGYNVHIVTMDQVMNDPYARTGDIFRQQDGTYHVAYSDSAGVLRQFLKLYFSYYGTKYVLLAGTDIPYRHFNQTVEGQTIDCVSDFYYIELNSDWSEDTIKDHAPDLYVGRILAREPSQLDNYTDKLYRYELNPGNGDYTYLKRILLQEGHEFYTSLNSFKNDVSNIFTHKIILPHNIKGKNVIDTLNVLPVGMINIFNHGDTLKITVHSGNNNNPENFIHSISNGTSGYGLNCLKNNNYPMIFYSSSCQTVPFDNKYGINMGESFTTGKNYGGPVYIGYTRKIRTSSLHNVVNNFSKRLKNGDYILGSTDAISVWEYHSIYNRIKLQTPSYVHAYIGDPSLSLWTEIPQQYNNLGIYRTDNSITISGIDVDSTTVSYYGMDGFIQTSLVSSSFTIDKTPNASVILHKHNAIPYFIPMVLQNTTLNKSLYIIASDVTAGYAVDNDRSHGDVVVGNGTNYEIEASGTVTLQDGFKVEKGATFAVYPSTF